MSSVLRVKIYTRSMSKEMYSRAMSFVDLPYPKGRIVGSTSISYLLDVVKDESADIVVNIDEDAFVTDVDSLRGLIDYVIERKYVNCGMPDGGVVPIRHHHPLVTNPFFTIMNTAEIRKQLRPGVFEGFPLASEEYVATHPQELLRSPYDMDGYEPYNELLLWVARNFSTLYLDARTHPDGKSTVLLNHEGRPFVMHTWYARKYLKDAEETRRIDDRIKEAAGLNPAGRTLSNLDVIRHWALPRVKSVQAVGMRALKRARRNS